MRTTVFDPAGCLFKQYEYNGHGQVIRETDGEGKEILYRYNGLGLKSREQTSIRREGDVTYYRVISYRYDRQGNKIEEAYGKQEVTRDGEPSGWHKIHFAYDSNNHLVEVKDDFGARMRCDYDCLGNPVLEERAIEDGVIQRIRYGYNKNGWRIQKTEEIQGNGPVRTVATRYGYDENGNLNWIKTPKGFEIRRKYDADDRLIEERVRDKRNGIDRRICYAYDAAGNLLSVTVKGTEKGEELRSSYQYDLKDRLTHRIGRNHAVTRYFYDQNDQLIKEIAPYGYNKESDSGAGTSYSYDSRGNRIRVVNGFGQTVEERVYNLQDRPAIFKDGYGNQTAFTYTPDGQIKEVRRERDSRNENKVLQSYE